MVLGRQCKGMKIGSQLDGKAVLEPPLREVVDDRGVSRG